MNFTLKYFKDLAGDIIKKDGWDTKAILWISKNKKLVTASFKSKFPKSPVDFVVQIKTKRGSILVDSTTYVKPKTKCAYLSIKDLKKLGYNG